MPVKRYNSLNFMEDCIFCKIVSREIPSNIIYEDENAVAFPDIHPKKPIHILVIPKKHIREFLEVTPDIVAHLTNVIQSLVRKQGLIDKGYKLVVSGGGFQEVDHFHMHIMGPMGKSVQA